MDYSSDTPRRRTWPLVASILVAVIAVGIAVFFFVQNRELQQQTSKEPSAQQPSNDEVIAKVAKIYEAPKEKPSVAQVGDKSKLEDEPFFKNAQQGDYILIYPEAKTAVLYRLPTNEIINIGPVSTQ